MSGTNQRWWRMAAIAVVSGSAAAGGWLGLARAEPLPSPQLKGVPNAKSDAVVPWVRSNAPPPVVVRPASEPLKVLAAPGKFPQPNVDPAILPIAAQIPAPPVPAMTVPVRVQPPVPPIPDAIPAPKPFVPKSDGPAIPAPPPLLNPAPVPPPVKSAEPLQPMPPTIPDFNLRPSEPGNNVKSADPVLPVPTPVTVPALTPTLPVPAVVNPLPAPTLPEKVDPVPAVPTSTNDPGVPTFSSSRTKPVDEPIDPTVKDVFQPPVTPPSAIAPSVPLNIGAPTPTLPTTLPGDTTMTTRQTILASVAGLGLAFSPESPVRADDATQTDVVELTKKLEAATKRLDDAELEIKRLLALVEGRKDEKGFPLPSDPGAVAEIKSLKDKIASLEKQVSDLKSTTALKPSVPVTNKGTVRVVNEYPVPVSIIVNEKSYRVEPSTTLNVDIPTGDFTYQLLQSGAPPTKSIIKEKEVVTLRVK